MFPFRLERQFSCLERRLDYISFAICRSSRIRLAEWFGFRLSTGTICKCVREAGVCCYPAVDQLVEELQQQKQVGLDETPWYQKGVFLWLWVAMNENIAVYLIGSRKKEELLKLITEAFFGWLITDGYLAYRHYSKRQRCLAHLIR